MQYWKNKTYYFILGNAIFLENFMVDLYLIFFCQFLFISDTIQFWILEHLDSGLSVRCVVMLIDFKNQDRHERSFSISHFWKTSKKHILWKLIYKIIWIFYLIISRICSPHIHLPKMNLKLWETFGDIGSSTDIFLNFKISLIKPLTSEEQAWGVIGLITSPTKSNLFIRH